MRRTRALTILVTVCIATFGATQGIRPQAASADTLSYSIAAGVLQAVDSTSTVVWTYSAPAGTVNDFVVSGSRVVASTSLCTLIPNTPVCTYTGWLAGLDASSGTVAWAISEGGKVTSPRVHNTMAFGQIDMSADAYIHHARVHAVDLQTGATIWNTTLPDGQNGTFPSGSLTVANSRVAIPVQLLDPLFFTTGTGATTFTLDEATGAIAGGPVAAIGAASIHEGNSRSRTLKFPVTLENTPLPVNGAVGPFTVQYTISSGTATGGAAPGAGIDFNNAGGVTKTLTIGPNPVFISVPIYGDAANESDEQFTITLSNPSPGFVIATPTATGTIFNDDASGVPVVGISDAQIAEGTQQAATRKLAFNVTLSAPIANTVTLTFFITNGTATSPSDYKGAAVRTVTFVANNTAVKTVNVNVVRNGLPEGDETVNVSLIGVTGITPSQAVRSSGIGTITNDD